MKTVQKGKRTWRLLPPTKWFGINTHPSHSSLLLFRVPFGACLRLAAGAVLSFFLRYTLLAENLHLGVLLID
jgi:hypothetical protein